MINIQPKSKEKNKQNTWEFQSLDLIATLIKKNISVTDPNYT